MPTTKQYIFNKSEDGKSANILIDGEISPWWGVGLRDMAKDIANADAENIMLQINSGGGSVFEGMAMSSFIKSNPVNINTSVLGLCASIATIISMSGKVTYIAKGSQWMIHEATGGTFGRSSEMRKDADLVDSINYQIARGYVDTIEKNGKLLNGSREDEMKRIVKEMKDETWFTAEEAVERGFIQNLTEGVEFINKANAQDIMNSCSKYKNTPAEFLNKVKTIANMPTKEEEKAKEEGLFSRFSAWIKSNPTATIEEKAEPTAAEKLEAAKALVEASGLKIETTAKVEEPAKVVEADETLKAELAKVKAEKEALELKAQKLEEEKAGASVAGPKREVVATEEKELTDKQLIENLLAPQMETLDVMAKSIFK